MKQYKRIFLTYMCYIILICNVISQSTPRVSIQGTLKDNNGIAIADGEYAVTFKLYDHPTSGTAKWSEEATVSVAGGIYNHFLGSVNPLIGSNFSSVLYVGVKVGASELTPRTELTYAPYAFSVQQVACSGAVGDIKYSILKPSDFATVNGNCWIPLDGRSISGSELSATIGSNSIPDAGGLFIRAQEFSNSPNIDYGRTSSSPIATPQIQAFLAHNHPVNDPGHSHTYQDAQHKESVVYHYINAGENGYDVGHYLTTEATRATENSNPSITVQNSSGSETRPKNLNFWLYIRIN